MSYRRYFKIATPIAAGGPSATSGVMTSQNTAPAGPRGSVRTMIGNSTAIQIAANAARVAIHLICWRCSGVAVFLRANKEATAPIAPKT